MVGLGRDTSGVPLHFQIRQHLLKEIETGRLGVQDRLPSERELMAQFEVSRITARRALNDLASMGLISREPGRGSFVKELKIEQELRALTGFVEDMKTLGLDATSGVVEIEEMPASRSIAQSLGVDVGQQIFHIERVRIANGQPISLDISYLRADIGSQIAKENLVTDPFYAILEQKMGIPLGHGDYVIDSIAASARVARYLDMEPGAPILRIERTAYALSDDSPLIYEFLHYRGDRVRYRLSLPRGSDSGSSPAATATTGPPDAITSSTVRRDSGG